MSEAPIWGLMGTGYPLVWWPCGPVGSAEAGMKAYRTGALLVFAAVAATLAAATPAEAAFPAQNTLIAFE